MSSGAHGNGKGNGKAQLDELIRSKEEELQRLHDARRRWEEGPLAKALEKSGVRREDEAVHGAHDADIGHNGMCGGEIGLKGERLVRGRFGGVDGEGALLLETASGPRRIVSGELLGRAA